MAAWRREGVKHGGSSSHLILYSGISLVRKTSYCNDGVMAAALSGARRRLSMAAAWRRRWRKEEEENGSSRDGVAAWHLWCGASLSSLVSHKYKSMAAWRMAAAAGRQAGKEEGKET